MLDCRSIQFVKFDEHREVVVEEQNQEEEELAEVEVGLNDSPFIRLLLQELAKKLLKLLILQSFLNLELEFLGGRSRLHYLTFDVFGCLLEACVVMAVPMPPTITSPAEFEPSLLPLYRTDDVLMYEPVDTLLITNTWNAQEKRRTFAHFVVLLFVFGVQILVVIVFLPAVIVIICLLFAALEAPEFCAAVFEALAR